MLFVSPLCRQPEPRELNTGLRTYCYNFKTKTPFCGGEGGLGFCLGEPNCLFTWIESLALSQRGFSRLNL